MMILMRDDEVLMIREGSDDNVDDRELFEALEMLIGNERCSIVEWSDDDDDNRELLEVTQIAGIETLIYVLVRDGLLMGMLTRVTILDILTMDSS